MLGKREPDEGRFGLRGRPWAPGQPRSARGRRERGGTPRAPGTDRQWYPRNKEQQSGLRVYKSRARGGLQEPSGRRRAARSAPGAPHCPGRAARRLCVSLAGIPGPPAGPQRVREARFKVAGEMGGVGKKEGPGDHGHQLPPRGPRGSEPRCLSPGALPCLWGARLSRGAERALGTLAPHQDRRLEFCSHALSPALRQHPAPASRLVRGPLEVSPNPAPAAGDSRTVTQFPLGRARGLHRRSRKCAVPGPFPCSVTGLRGGCFLYSPLRLPPQLGSPGGSADSFPLLPGLENLRLRRGRHQG